MQFVLIIHQDGIDMIEKDFIEIFRGALAPADCQTIIDYMDNQSLTEGMFRSRKGVFVD